MNGKSCFFIGDREAGEEIFSSLKEAIEIHIEGYRVQTFIVGNYGNFDKMTSKLLVAAKREYPQITLLRLIPYRPDGRPKKAPPGFDGIYYPLKMEDVPRGLARVTANEKTVDKVDFLIAYTPHPASNSHKLVEYAKRRRRVVVTRLFPNYLRY